MPLNRKFHFPAKLSITAKRTHQYLQSLWKRHRSKIKYALVALLTIALTEPIKWYYQDLGTTVSQHFQRPEYTIVLAGPEVGPDRNLWSDVLKGMEEAKRDFADVFGKMDITIRTENDGGDAKQAKELAHRLASDKSVLAIIGPCQSSIAQEVLPIYRECGKPLIMPIPTNPTLTENNQKSEVNNIFRLPPTDNSQIDCLANLIQELNKTNAPGSSPQDGPASVAILRDHSNQKYSNYIADGVRDSLEGLSADRNALPPRIIIDGTIGLPGNGLHFTDSMAQMCRHSTRSVVLYVGMRDNGLTLIRQARALGLTCKFVLTDGCVDSHFARLGSTDVEGVYATFPSAAGQSNKSNTTGLQRVNPSFTDYGYDAVAIVANALERLELGEVSPKSLLTKINEAKANRTIKGRVCRYQFDANGDNRNASFHVWEVDSGLWNYCSKPILFEESEVELASHSEHVKDDNKD